MVFQELQACLPARDSLGTFSHLLENQRNHGNHEIQYPPGETKPSPLKINAWKDDVSFWAPAYFQVLQATTTSLM